jgi:TetR/AcrR family transcriptional regulator
MIQSRRLCRAELGEARHIVLAFGIDGKCINEERCQRLLDAAWTLLQADTYEEIGIADVARAAGLAKGTVYLYFNTKEELFLTVQTQQIEAWLDALDVELAALQGSGDINGVAGAVCRSLCERPAMARLLSKLHVILAQNAGYEAVLQFKQALLARIIQTGALLEGCLPFLASGWGVASACGTIPWFLGRNR